MNISNTKELSSVERLRRTYEFGKIDRLFRRGFYFWPQTIERWKREGLPDNYEEINFFGFEEEPYFAESLIDLGWTGTPFCPEYKYEIIEENGNWRVVRDTCGTIKKLLKNRIVGYEGMPQYLKSCVENRQDWETDVKHRLLPETPERWKLFEKEKDQVQKDVLTGKKLYSANIIGGYMHLRNLLNPEKLLYVFYDDPLLIHDIMRNWLYLMVTCLCKVQDIVPIFRLFIAEDICYKTGPLISPTMIKSFLIPYYKELYETLRNRQKEKLFFEIDTDGSPHQIISVYREAGMTAMSPFEVAAGCDVVALGQQYPWLVMSGGIDKRVLAAGKEAIDREVERIIPAMVKRGGYYPTCDHGVPEDVSLENYMHYRKRVLELDH